MNKNLSLLTLCFVVVFHASALFADSVGIDSTVNAMNKLDLFEPHGNFCDTQSEVFVAVQGTDMGFCMETAERTAADWFAARKNCLDEKKRLPEVSEYIFSCLNVAGLSGMTDNWEWVSNASAPGPIASQYENMIPIVGNGACKTITNANYGSFGYPIPSFTYRCLR